MPNPYSSVERSAARKSSVEFNPPESQIVSLLYGEKGFGGTGFVVENSRNPWAWIDATDDDSFVDLGEMR